MTFSEALEQAIKGKSIKRSGWNGVNQHVYVEDGYTQTIGDGVFKGHDRVYAPVLVLFNAQGVHQPGWVPSQGDMFASDWDIAVHE